MLLQHAKLIAAMTAYDRGDARRIQHFIKVHDLAATIGRLDGIDDSTLFILETAAIVHDIGIHLSEKKYGDCNGKHQEMEGPAEAAKLLRSVGGYTEAQTERVCWLVGHHHTYSNITDRDHQILVEADFIVNFFEDNASETYIRNVRKSVFRTEAGKNLLDEMFGLDVSKDSPTGK